MKKFAGMSYDVTDLVSEGKINYLVNLVKGDPDELTKTAHIPSKDELEGMSSNDFALVLYHPQIGFLKKYAVHDKYITKLNMKIFQDNHEHYPDEIAKTAAYYLAKAAKNFRIEIPEPIQKLAEGKHITNIVDLDVMDKTAWHNKQAGHTKQASEVEYALPEKKKYPIHTAELVKKAVAYFNQHAMRFEPMEALQFAARVKTAAQKHSVPFENTILAKYASLTATSFNDDMKHLVRARRRYVSAEDKGIYDELLEKSASFGVIKTAEYLEKIDRKLGIHRQWNSAVEDPFLTVLGHVKEATCKMHNGKKVYKHQLKKAAEAIVDADTLKDLEGPDGLEVFDSLPTPIKNKITKNI